MADVQRCPECGGRTTVPDEQGAHGWEHAAIDVLPELLRAWARAARKTSSVYTNHELSIIYDILTAALAKLGLTTREQIEDAIREMEAKRADHS